MAATLSGKAATSGDEHSGNLTQLLLLLAHILLLQLPYHSATLLHRLPFVRGTAHLRCSISRDLCCCAWRNNTAPAAVPHFLPQLPSSALLAIAP